MTSHDCFCNNLEVGLGCFREHEEGVENQAGIQICGSEEQETEAAPTVLDEETEMHAPLLPSPPTGSSQFSEGKPNRTESKTSRAVLKTTTCFLLFCPGPS